MDRQWIKNAPERLIRAYQLREIRNGRVLLERLLSDPRMLLAWAQLARHVRADKQWIRVWSAISYARQQSKKRGLHKKRRDESDDYVLIAKRCSALVKKIRDKPLDVLTYELFPQDALEALHVESLHDMDEFQRSDVAHRLLPCWPSVSELLCGLEKRALVLAEDSMTRKRVVERNRGDVPARVFFWNLGREFRNMFGDPMLGTLSKIGDVVLNSDVKKEYSRSFVQSAMQSV